MAWVTPTNKSTGTVITASHWNQDVVANPIVLKTSINDAGTAWQGLVNTSVQNGHGLGQAGISNAGVLMNLTATSSSGLASAQQLDGTVTAAANSAALALLSVGQNGAFAKSTFTGLTAGIIRIVGANVTSSGGGVIDTAAAIRIVSAPNIATSNYALLIDSGNAHMNGSLQVQGNLNGAGTIKSIGQPGFLAFNSADDVDAATPVDFDTEVYDELGNFSGDTFTAPVAGRYLLCANVQITKGTGAFSFFSASIFTSNRSYAIANDFAPPQSGSFWTYGGSVIADMDAGDTASVSFATTGTVTIKGNNSGVPCTYFSGRLLP